jgi:hypothetical protein
VKTLWAFLIVPLACGVARASGGAATDAYADIDDVDIHALGDGYWLRNFDAPASGRNQLREFDFDTGFALNYARSRWRGGRSASVSASTRAWAT